MTAIDEYLANNARYAESFSGPLPMPPSKNVAVVACMDARLNVYALLGLGDGEAHVIRNAGGVITDDEIRSLAISQRLLGTREIMLIHHTDCGMLTFTDDAFKRSIQDETGIKPSWGAESFGDLDEDVRQSIARIKASFRSCRTPAASGVSSSTSRPASSTRSADPVPSDGAPVPDRPVTGAPVVDAHQHVWDLSAHAQPWLASQ